MGILEFRCVCLLIHQTSLFHSNETFNLGPPLIERVVGSSNLENKIAGFKEHRELRKSNKLWACMFSNTDECNSFEMGHVQNLNIDWIHLEFETQKIISTWNKMLN